jgi:hypothetical protein
MFTNASGNHFALAGVRITTLDPSLGGATATNVANLIIDGNPTSITGSSFTGSLWVKGNSKFDTLITSGAGINFGQSTLSNYTVGTPTPTVTLVGGVGNTVPVYSVNTLRATQVGNIRTVRLRLSGDGGAEGAGTGRLNVDLGVSVSASSPDQHILCGYLNNGSLEAPLYAVITAGSSTVFFSYQDTIITTAPVLGNTQNNSSRTIEATFSYEV